MRGDPHGRSPIHPSPFLEVGGRRRRRRALRLDAGAGARLQLEALFGQGAVPAPDQAPVHRRAREEHPRVRVALRDEGQVGDAARDPGAAEDDRGDDRELRRHRRLLHLAPRREEALLEGGLVPPPEQVPRRSDADQPRLRLERLHARRPGRGHPAGRERLRPRRVRGRERRLLPEGSLRPEGPDAAQNARRPRAAREEAPRSARHVWHRAARAQERERHPVSEHPVPHGRHLSEGRQGRARQQGAGGRARDVHAAAPAIRAARRGELQLVRVLRGLHAGASRHLHGRRELRESVRGRGEIQGDRQGRLRRPALGSRRPLLADLHHRHGGQRSEPQPRSRLPVRAVGDEQDQHGARAHGRRRRGPDLDVGQPGRQGQAEDAGRLVSGLSGLAQDRPAGTAGDRRRHRVPRHHRRRHPERDRGRAGRPGPRAGAERLSGPPQSDRELARSATNEARHGFAGACRALGGSGGPFEAPSQWAHRHARWLFPAPAVLLVAVIIVYPIAYTGWMSLQEWFASSLTRPRFIGLSNYAKIIFGDARFREAVARTIYFTVLAVAAETLLGVAMALLFNREFWGRGLLRTLAILPMVATPTAIALVFVMMYHPTLGVANYLVSLVGLSPFRWTYSSQTALYALALVDVWQWTPLIMLIALAGLASLPREPYEAGQLVRDHQHPALQPGVLVLQHGVLRVHGGGALRARHGSVVDLDQGATEHDVVRGGAR